MIDVPSCRSKMIAGLGFAILACGIQSQLAAQGVGKQTPTAEQRAQMANLLRSIDAMEQELATTNRSLNQVDTLLKDLVKQRDEEQKKQDKMGISGASFDGVLRTLQTQRVELMIEMAGLEARADLLKDKRESLRRESNSQNQEILNRLSQLLKVQQEKLAALAKSKYNADAINQIETAILDTQIRIATIKKDAGNQARQSLNRQLTDVALARAENKARLAMVEQLLTKYVSSRGGIGKVNELNVRIADKNRQVTDYKDREKVINAQIEAFEKELEKLKAKYDFDK